MCRIVALPPGFTKQKALAIVEDFYIGNDDGTGSVYVENGEFKVNKYNFSFEEVMKKKLPLFDHMPYNGWTLAHVRAASHGKKTMNNTHPFIKGDCAMVHNGIFREYAPVKAALSATHTFDGETDSEVAAVLWQVAGKKKFIKAVDSGVFMFLNRNGQVDVVCNTGGDLTFQRTRQGVVMASSLPDTYRRTQSVLEGHFKLGLNGQIIHSKWEKDTPSKWFSVSEYGDYTPTKQNWKPKKGKTTIQKDSFDSFPDDFTSVRGRGYIWL